MKIVLCALNASYMHTNLALRCIAKVLREKGYNTEILERSMKDRSGEILHALAAADADIYGFSVYIWNRDAILSLAAQLRELRPAVRIVVGGPEVSYEDESFFQMHPYVDSILCGEGETVFPAYCRELPPRHTILCGDIYEGFTETGILYDEYPPDSHTGGILYYESSRGCPFRCSYCLSSAGGGVRAKTAEQTALQLLEFEKLQGVRVIKFVDRTFNFDRRRADRIWQALAGEEYTKTYHFEICADLLDEENFAVLSGMPPGKIQFECGVQSTNPDTLREIGRHRDTEKILSTLARLRSMGNIHIHADLIAGLPHEDFSSFARSFDDTYPVCDMLQLGFLKLLPGTKLRRECKNLGYRYSPRPPYEVFVSDALSYEELYRLHGIDDVLERYSSSGHFPHTLQYLMENETSPFAFFDALAKELPPVRALSQRSAVLALRDFALRRGAEETRLDGCLILDWLLYETGSPPYPLRIKPVSGDADVRKNYCTAHPEAAASSVCAAEIPYFGTVTADRVLHRYEIVPR